jgi:hypothetical protein
MEITFINLSACLVLQSTWENIASELNSSKTTLYNSTKSRYQRDFLQPTVIPNTRKVLLENRYILFGQICFLTKINSVNFYFWRNTISVKYFWSKILNGPKNEIPKPII